jgi:sialic acid synthase SpsE
VIKLPSGRAIGEGMSPFVIAEVGSNWASLDDCLKSVAMADKCGADAVKFQAFTRAALFGPVAETDARGPHPTTLPLEWLPKLKEKADACGIEFMCSAFSPELIEAVDRYVSIHKNASAELTHLRMLETYRRIGKPVVLSTGASGDMDIDRALGVLGETPTVLLYCVGAYPARIQELAHIDALRTQFKRPAGLSDHTTDVVLTPQVAACHGAVVIEKHVNFVGAQGPDAPHSLSTDEFKLYVQAAKDPYHLEIARQHGDDPAFVTRHNRRLIATRDIPEGGTLQEGVNFGIYRSLRDDTRAASPWLIDRINGKVAQRAIMAGEGVALNDVA